MSERTTAISTGNTTSRSTQGQRGTVLIIALVLLAIVTLLGISGSTNMLLESRVSGNTAASNELRQGADSLVMQLLRAPPSGLPSVHVLTSEVINFPTWNWIDGAGDGNWPLPADCAAARWRMRQLEKPANSGTDSNYNYYELQADCFAGPDVNGDGSIDELDGPFARVITGMRVINS